MHIALSLCLILYIIPSHAKQYVIDARSMNALKHYEQCFVGAAKRYEVNIRLLQAIAVAESSAKPETKEHTKNTNGTIDVGFMGVNTWWLPKLKKYGLGHSDLYDVCTNIYLGGWILSHSVDYFGNNWNAVGGYNAGTGKKPENQKARDRYSRRVYRYYRELNARM